MLGQLKWKPHSKPAEFYSHKMYAQCYMRITFIVSRFQKFLAAADFLQNVVYINIPMSEDEKVVTETDRPKAFLMKVLVFQIQKFAVLAELYDDLGMHRKAGFFRRICAMQSVVPSNPKPAWQFCYHVLLNALPSYHLSLDPKEHKTGMVNQAHYIYCNTKLGLFIRRCCIRLAPGTIASSS